jgi:hemerythrin-like metal-binding protein
MTVLEWSDALVLQLPAMDEIHEEFVERLAAVEQAPDDALLAAWRALVAHTERHFGQEDEWMLGTRFASSHCHMTQHRVVLGVMREGAAQGAKGQLEVIREMARELAAWFVQHAQGMDAALALHLRSADVGLSDVRLPGGHAMSEPSYTVHAAPLP